MKINFCLPVFNLFSSKISFWRAELPVTRLGLCVMSILNCFWSGIAWFDSFFLLSLDDIFLFGSLSYFLHLYFSDSSAVEWTRMLLAHVLNLYLLPLMLLLLMTHLFCLLVFASFPLILGRLANCFLRSSFLHAYLLTSLLMHWKWCRKPPVQIVP